MNILMKLYSDNPAAKVPKADLLVSNDAGQTIYVRGPIADGYNANAADLVDAINRADPAATLNIRFNTPGGDVFQSKEVSAAIRAFAGKTIAYVDSLCASAGTSMAIACDEVVMSKGAFFMVHNAQGIALGDKKAIRDRADLIEKVELSIVDEYVAKTGKSAEEIIAMMDEETWMDCDEALANGFVDRIAGAEGGASNTWNLAAYNKAPAALAAPAAAPAPAVPPAPIENTAPAPSAEPEPAPAPAAPEPSMTQANTNRLALIQAM